MQRLTASPVTQQWWNIGTRSRELYDMKSSLRTGSYQDLNIYTTLMQDDVVGCERAQPEHQP